MNSIKFMYAAYAVTWAIHVFYLSTVIRRYRRLRQELRALGKGKQAVPRIPTLEPEQ